jgi:hypothetical protein
MDIGDADHPTFFSSENKPPFTLSLSFDFAQDIRKTTVRGESVEPQAEHDRLM